MIDVKKPLCIYDDRGKAENIKVERLVSSYEKDGEKVYLAILSDTLTGEDKLFDKLIMFDAKTGNVLTSNFDSWYVENLKQEPEQLLIFKQDFYSYMDRAGEGVFANVVFTLDKNEPDFEKAIKVSNVYFDKSKEDYIYGLGATPESWADFIWGSVKRDGASRYFFFEAVDFLTEEQTEELSQLYPDFFN